VYVCLLACLSKREKVSKRQIMSLSYYHLPFLLLFYSLFLAFSLFLSFSVVCTRQKSSRKNCAFYFVSATKNLLSFLLQYLPTCYNVCYPISIHVSEQENKDSISCNIKNMKEKREEYDITK